MVDDGDGDGGGDDDDDDDGDDDGGDDPGMVTIQGEKGKPKHQHRQHCGMAVAWWVGPAAGGAYRSGSE